ncbi:response regulator [Lysobacter arvi]|uniref:histidine kinase n=1 Tax=Lysobacter arvi TaxID=3038776 RepID=A0ABU1CI96_9GAMM|nr:response regulator [Lysobacter arvi]MDR0184671.1 response regulator [Lysobacter arvi]
MPPNGSPPQGSPVPGPLHVLMIEDCSEDAELLSEQLLEAGLQATFHRVDSESALREALARERFDVVLSDLSLPGFSGMEALRILRERDAELPFIFVSGTIGEETAVDALHRGANDYVLKQNPARLPNAVARAVREARNARERERAEQELMRSQRLDCLAMLAAGLSHDLRNVLQPLLIVPDLLNAYSDDPNIHRLSALVAESGRRGHEMAESMLAFVRGSHRASEDVAVAQLFQAVSLLLQGTLPRNVTLRCEPLQEDLVVHCNYIEFQQCLVNLALNGVQAMAERGGELRLSARRALQDGGERLCIRVSDEGCGMDADTRAKLFTPFFTTKPEGTGLGLLSCKRFVDSLQGRIVVESEVGQGTTFDLHLPLRANVDADGAAEERFAVGHGQRILLVDGDGTRLSLLANALDSQGYEPLIAVDGAAALRLLAREGLPALAIIDSDILMLSAVSLLLALRDAGFDGPVITLGDPADPLRHDALPSNAVAAVLQKPLRMSAVFRAVERALGAGERG